MCAPFCGDLKPLWGGGSDESLDEGSHVVRAGLAGGTEAKVVRRNENYRAELARRMVWLFREMGKSQRGDAFGLGGGDMRRLEFEPGQVSC